MTSVFAKLAHEAWPYHYRGTLHIGTLCGGVPSDEKTAIGWINAKLKDTRSRAEIEELVMQTMADKGITQDEAIEDVATNQMAGTNGFKRDHLGLYIEGRQLKSALKEAVSVSVASGKVEQRGWGKTNKGLLSYFSEHVFIPEEKLYIMRDGKHVTEPDGIFQKMVHTWRGDAISYDEYVQDVDVEYTVETDHRFTYRDWAMIWLTGQNEGIGASRSQGFGTYEVTGWEELDQPGTKANPRSPKRLKQQS